MIDKDSLQELAEAHLTTLISEASESLGPDFDPHAPFGELGINSFYVLKIIKRLEADFGTLPKSLLFEHFNVADLANYFVDHHQPTLVAKFAPLAQQGAPGEQAPAPAMVEPAPPVTRAIAPAAPIRITEEDAQADPMLRELVDALFERYKAEGSVSRGTRKIAPNLFIGSERRGYFNYARHRDIVLVYGYAGPRDYLPALAAEIHLDCARRGLQLNVLCDQPLPPISGTVYSATPFGVLQRITNLQSFTLQGGAMRRLRYLVNKFAKSGQARTQEYHCGTQPQTDTAIAEVIDRWCAGRTMVNPLVHDVRQEVLDGTLGAGYRLFLTWLDDSLQNVILITRMSADENGYLMDLEFYPPEMPLGGLEFAIARIIDTLAAEGCELLSLGGTYGCKLEACPEADPALDALLDELREQNIFNDDGNFQFKNKFRPENRSLYLCRAVDCGNADNVLDIIMMIADPLKTRTPDVDASDNAPLEPSEAGAAAQVADGCEAVVPVETVGAVAIAGNERSRLLASAGFNALAVAHQHVDFDLKSDSWALLEMPAIDGQMQALHARLQQPVDIEESLRGVFPFSHFTLTDSGQAAENVLFGAWERKGLILQNLLFPSTIFHQIDKGFELRELPDPDVFRLDVDARYKGDIAWDALREAVVRDAGSIAMVCIEVGDNAAGGYPVSLHRLKEAKTLLAAHGIPLAIDATRVVENARRVMDLEVGYADKSVWTVVREILACADVVFGSLTKDFCVRKGGIVACNDAGLSNRMRDLLNEHGGGLDPIDRRLVALSLQSRRQIETRVLRRMEAVRQIWTALHESGVPVAHPVGAHCVLIDVKRLPQFQALAQPVASFLAWLYLNTGIRAAAHSAGMQTRTPLNDLVRLAVPVGMAQSAIDELIARMVDAFKAIVDLPELVAEPGTSAPGDAHARYRLRAYRNLAGTLVDAAAPDDTPAAATIAAPRAPEETRACRTGAPAPAGAGDKASGGPGRSKDIAIVGMAGRYPKASSMAECWHNLSQGRDCIEELPFERWQRRQQHEPVERYRGGFIDGIDRFDSLFFNISPREAEMLDPQERLFLEVAWEAIEDAGYYPEILAQEGADRSIGVFVGAVWTMYQVLGVEERRAGHKLTPNSFLWSIANRVSYWMNLTGPSLTLDTACSSSLTAIHLACEAINAGDCAAALVGGVNLDVHQAKLDINQFGGALSADGVCRSFGKGANGYVAGEGVGALLLKPLERAIQDGDHVYGVIKSAVVNHGGRTSGYMVPNPKAQAGLVAAALDKAGVDARSIGYIEAHGTGTELGDPIEITALNNVFQTRGVATQSCAIGSIKSNIGHLEAAAGVVGVTKVLLQLRHRRLVPSLHSAEPNEFIDFENSPFRVQQTLEEWVPKIVDGMRCPLRAGVSSFGAGGANAHVVLEEYQPAPRPAFAECDRIFPLSACSEDQLRQMADRLAEFLESSDDIEGGGEELADIAHTLQVGRKSFDHRLAIIARTRQQLVGQLRAYLEGDRPEGIAVGQVKSADGVTRLLSRSEKDEFAHLLAQRRDPAKVAELWVAGLLADWQGFGSEGRRVPLPTYPFADKRHWVGGQAPSRRTALPGIQLHPLVDSNESTFERQIFKKSFHDRDFFIYDHHVSDIPTLPGVAYLELARKAGEIAAGRKVQKIGNVLWVAPITVQDATAKDVYIELKPGNEAVQFEVFSGTGDGRTLHSQGKLLYATAQDETAEPEYIDLAAIRGRCEKVIDGPQAYPLFESLGLRLGPSFQVLQEVYKNEEETLGILKLPEFRTDDLACMVLHPSLVDGSLQAGMGGQLGSKVGEMFVPFSIGEVEILHPLQANCYSYVTEVKDQRKPGSQVLKTNVWIVDENGKILVKIRESTGVPLREVHKPPAEAANAEGFTRLYYGYDWEPAALADSAPAASLAPLLLFGADDTLGAACERRGAERDVILVRPGEQFERAGDREYRIDPGNRDDYRLLFDAVRASGAVPENIGFAWPLCVDEAGESADDAVLEQALARGVYPFLFLCQTLVELGLEGVTRLFYLYAGSPGAVEPQHEAVGGFVKALRLEHPRLACRVVEVCTPDADIVLDALCHELSAGRDDAVAIRHDAHGRHVRTLKRLDLDDTRAAAPVAPREGGTYLITGGAGGLGLLFAEYLARTCRARLVLSGRSAPTAALETRLDALREAGAEVLYVAADVSCREDVARLLEQGRTRFGDLNGVIHAAGVLRDALVRNKTPEEMQAVFAPKIFGVRNLDELTSNDPLDFFVTFSSLAGVAGNAGQSDYSFANHYMDSFAAQRAARGARDERPGKTLSINWSLWADGGMKLDEQTELYFRRTLGIRPLPTDAGIDAFLQGLASTRSQVAVLEGVQEKIELAWGLRKKATPTATAATLAPAADGAGDLQAWLESGLSQIVMEFLKLDAADVATDKILLDLGFDSLGLTTFANAVNDRYQLDITPVLFFDYPSIGEIAGYLAVERESELRLLYAGSAPEPATRSQTPPPMSADSAVPAFALNKGWNPAALDHGRTPGPGSATSFSPDRRFVEKPLAIVGMSGVMPQSEDLEVFWENLKNARDLISVIPGSRWRWEDYYGDPQKEPNTSNSKWGGFMHEVDKFDPLFFGISPREAAMMDPQQRIFLETVWRAVEDSGHKVSDLSGTRTGLFVGVATNDYIDIMNGRNVPLDGYTASGNSHSVLANRVSFLLNLRGPSAPIDTACSSSLVALHRAVESIHTGSCDMAIVGGVQVMLSPAAYISFGTAGMLSSDGKCKTFDKRADGYVRGEGAGAILIKSLAAAEADGDHIYAVIKATAENHGGRVTTLTAPNSAAQAELLVEAYEKAQIDPATVGYIECHGTGTPLGDPIEIQALTKAFAELYKRHDRTPAQAPHCGLSSVKTNIGHLETAAGIAGVLKLLLAMQHRHIPANLHFDEVNPYIDLRGTPFYIADKLTPWPAPLDQHGSTLPRRAGVSSFGFGGANAHIVLEEYVPPVRPPQLQAQGPHLIVLSAKNEDRLKAYAQSMRSYLATHEVDLADYAFTLQVGRDEMPERLALVVSDKDELIRKFDTFARGEGTLADACRGNTRSDEAMAARAGDVAAVQAALERCDLAMLAALWARGAPVDWRLLHPTGQPRRISVPSYPFARQRYWMPGEGTISHQHPQQAVATAAALHPLIHRNVSTLQEQKFASTFTGTEFYLADHVIASRKILPGVAYMEMARVAGELAGNAKVSVIRNLTWERPIIVGDEPREVEIALEPVGSEVKFSVRGSGEQAGIAHCHGRLEYATDGAGAERRDIAAIRQRCGEPVLLGDELYAFLRGSGLMLGSGFRIVQSIHANASESLSILRLPDHLRPDAAAFLLHPALMDGSLHTAMGLLRRNRMDIPMSIPFSVAEVRVFHPLDNLHYGYATWAVADPKDNPENLKVNFDLLDSNGEVLVRIIELVSRPLHGAAAGAAPGAMTLPAQAPAPKAMYYQNTWRESALPQPRPESVPTGNFLIFDHDEDLRDALEARLRHLQPDRPQVALVKTGATYRELEENVFEIDPAQQEDYRRLFHSLSQRKLLPANVIHAWAEMDFRTKGGFPESGLSRGVFSILHLTQSLLQMAAGAEDGRIKQKIKLLHLYPGSGDHPQPQHAATSGFCKSLVAEQPQFVCRNIELQGDDATPSNSESVAACVLAELQEAEAGSIDVRHVAGQREVRNAEALELAPAGKLNLRQNGVYVITGGAGGLGLIFAQYLAREVEARLVLVGRSPPGAAQEEQIRALEPLAAEVAYYQADVASYDDVERLLQEVRSRFGRIDGIIHCAGVLRDSTVASKTVQELREVLAAKVYGTVHLDAATAADDLDCFVLFSSLTAVTGNPGQSDYAYANRFMDEFSGLRNRLLAEGRRSGRTLSVNWPLWTEGGMRPDAGVVALLEQVMGIRGLETDAGLDAFADALASDRSQVVVLQGDRKKIDKMLGIRAAAGGNDETAAPLPTAVKSNVQAGTAMADRAEEGAQDKQLQMLVKKDLLRVASTILMVEEEVISQTVDMSEYGFDSIGLTRLFRELNETYALDLTPAVFFEYPTLDALSRFLCGEHHTQLHRHYAAQLAPTRAGALPDPPAVQAPDVTGKNRFSGGPVHHAQAVSAAPVASASPGGVPVAVVGMSGVMPQSEDLEEFWKNIAAEKDLVTEIPPERWDWTSYHGNPFAERNKTNSRWGGFMKEVDKFDPAFFGISPLEAELMDPQQRLFLETVWKAIEDAGHRPTDLAGTRTGVYVGVAGFDYLEILQNSKADVIAYTATGMAHCVLPNRISYLLDLHGPSEPIDTACSSSLVAIAHAVDAIASGTCEMAIAGGVNVLLSPSLYLAFGNAGMLSSDGKCKSFDKRADGYVRGEGCGAVLLKPLDRAIADGNHIYGVVRGAAVNHGGHATSLTAPNPNAQADLLVDVYQKARVDPNSVGYIEAHGTGTPLGDPVEINGLKKAFKELYKRGNQVPRDQAFCGVGSVKTNIGHLEMAAGIASFIKVLLAMKHGKIPGNIHHQELNPHIRLEGSPFYIVDRTRDWARLQDEAGDDLPRTAGVSSFGFGGANAHVVVQEYMAPAGTSEPADADHPDQELIVPLSAKTADQLQRKVQDLLLFISKEGHRTDLTSLAYTLQVGREAMEERVGFLVRSTAELAEKLQAHAAGEQGVAGIWQGQVKRNKDGMSIISQDDDIKQTIVDQCMARKQSSKLLSLWVRGLDFDWSNLYGPVKPRRISLPTYPFARNRCWIEATPGGPSAAAGASAPAFHPLLHANTSDLRQFSYSTVFQGDEFFLRNHRVVGGNDDAGVPVHRMLPPMIYLEMARAAVAAAMATQSHSTGIELQNVTWASPFDIAQGRPLTVAVFEDENGCMGYEVSSAESDGEGSAREVIHCRGAAVCTGRAEATKLDTRQLRRQMQPAESKGNGASSECYKGDGQQFLQLCPPEASSSSRDDYVLHPDVMQQALQAAVELIWGADLPAIERLSPVSLKALRILSPCTGQVHAWVRHARDSKTDDGASRVDITLVDQADNVCVIFNGLEFNDGRVAADGEEQRLEFEMLLDKHVHSTADSSSTGETADEVLALEAMLDDLIRG